MKQHARLDYIDVVRVISILLVFVFHCGRFFDPFGWHVKSEVTFEWMGSITSFVVIWMMPLIFFVSGASTSFALEKGVGRFVKRRSFRLLVPLIVGIFTHVYVQVYLENLTQKGFEGSLFDFFPHYFDGGYGLGGNFAWMGLHLWYLEMLFVLSMFLLPFFVFLRTKTGDLIVRGIIRACRIPGVIFLGALPVIFLDRYLNPNSVLGMKVWGGWSMVPYLFFLSYGFILFRKEEFTKILKQQWLFFVISAVLSASALFSGLIVFGDSISSIGGGWVMPVFNGLVSWAWILACISAAARFLNKRSPLLDYCNEAVLPFYVMHQSVLIIAGFFVFKLNLPIVPQYLVIMIFSFALISLVYEYFVRKRNIFRFLFGMNPVKPA